MYASLGARLRHASSKRGLALGEQLNSHRHRPTLRRRPRLSDRGQSMVEFALIVPILLLLLAAAVDLGRLVLRLTWQSRMRRGRRTLRRAVPPVRHVSQQRVHRSEQRRLARRERGHQSGRWVGQQPDDDDGGVSTAGWDAGSADQRLPRRRHLPGLGIDAVQPHHANPLDADRLADHAEAKSSQATVITDAFDSSGSRCLCSRAPRTRRTRPPSRRPVRSPTR